MCNARHWPHRRTAFTLIELLVVMALILVIFGLGVGYVVFGQDNQHSVTAANAVTGAFVNNRGRAHRDGLPTGVRLLFGTNGVQPTQVSQLQLIQQPEDYNAGQIAASAGGTTVSFSQTDFQGGAGYMGQIDESTIQIGDYFTLSGVQTPHRIINIAGPVGGETLTLASAVGPLATGAPYNIIRAPRRLPSEDVIQLPPSMVIENGPLPGNPGLTFCQNLPQRTLVDSSSNMTVAEIVFAPSGAVIGQGTGADKILLWLRDPAQPNATSGAPLLVSIQIRTGFISVYPVAPWAFGTAIAPGNDPYAYVKDGRASGM